MDALWIYQKGHHLVVGVDRRREVGRNEEGRSWPVEPLRLSVSAILSPCFCCCRPGTGELPDAPPSLSSPAIAAAIQEIYLV